ncbi:MAG: hypothetical protein HY908_28870, partial [Myxococcales bacterium]|nr:hypothetical protein [Myxococcales bacterium]
MIEEAVVERLARTLGPSWSGAPELADPDAAVAGIEALGPALRGAVADLYALWAAAALEPALARAAYELAAALGDPGAGAMQALAAAAADGSLARSSWGQVGNVEAVVAADRPSAYDRLAPLVTPGALDDAGVALLGQLLGSVRMRGALAADGRWRALARSLEGHPKLAADVRDYLARTPDGAPSGAPPALAPALASVAERVGLAGTAGAAAATTALRKAAFTARRLVTALGRVWGAAPGARA